MLRSYTSVKDDITSEFNEVKVNTGSGVQNISVLLKGIDKKDHYVPDKWPIAKNQRGPCCGLYALEIALNFGFSNFAKNIPPARKDKNKQLVSLRSVAKKQHLSGFGEIYDVSSFAVLTDHFKMPFCEVLPVDVKSVTEKRYVDTLISALDKHNTVIVACDIGQSFPKMAGGLHTHWALAFGYYKKNDEISILVTQYGHYYSWEAKQLYLCNRSLPDKNPKVGPTYGYCVIGATGEKDYTRSLPISNTEKIRYPIGDTLEKFRYGLFAVPAHPESRPIEFQHSPDEPVSYKRAKIGWRDRLVE